MDAYRYLKLGPEREGKEWPADQSVKPGSIIRLPLADPWPEGLAVFNKETCEWVSALWVETTDPRLVSSTTTTGEHRA